MTQKFILVDLACVVFFIESSFLYMWQVKCSTFVISPKIYVVVYIISRFIVYTWLIYIVHCSLFPHSNFLWCDCFIIIYSEKWCRKCKLFTQLDLCVCLEDLNVLWKWVPQSKLTSSSSCMNYVVVYDQNLCGGHLGVTSWEVFACGRSRAKLPAWLLIRTQIQISHFHSSCDPI